jgi:hypothetical protein
VAGQNKSWRTIRGQRPLNERRIATYKRLMQAEQRLAGVRRRMRTAKDSDAETVGVGVTRPDLAPDEHEDDIYLSAVARYVSALGGHIEVRAVFPEETITLLREPDD